VESIHETMDKINATWTTIPSTLAIKQMLHKIKQFSFFILFLRAGCHVSGWTTEFFVIHLASM